MTTEDSIYGLAVAPLCCKTIGYNPQIGRAATLSMYMQCWKYLGMLKTDWVFAFRGEGGQLVPNFARRKHSMRAVLKMTI